VQSITEYLLKSTGYAIVRSLALQSILRGLLAMVRPCVPGAITGNRVGRKPTRQGGMDKLLAGLLACLQFQKARQALTALLTDI
jgi:hypothetical protein